VWQQLTTDAADSQDVAHAAQKATAGFFAVAAALGVSLSPLSNQQLPPVYLEGDGEAQAALRRLKERAKATGADLFELILSGSMGGFHHQQLSGRMQRRRARGKCAAPGRVSWDMPGM
jgi:hypothetical protein